MYWLGIDVGTGGSRALLVDEEACVRYSAIAPHKDMLMPKPLWAEQEPDDWWAASQKAVRDVLKTAGVGGSSVQGVGLTGQMHGLVMLNAANEVIRPALIWCDQRSQRQVDSINSTLNSGDAVKWTANPIVTGWTLPKLLWVRDNEPERFEQLQHFLLPKDYVRFKLTGEYATDVSDASGTALFDVAHREWSRQMAGALGLDMTILPRAYESSEISGKISREGAEATGLIAGTPVVAGAGDQAASAIGNGIVEPGTVSCTIGTSGVVFAYLPEPVYDAAGRVHTFCHAIPNAWHVMGVTQGAGLSLQWYRNRFAPGTGYDDLTADATRSPAGSHGLFWLPYLMGERTPHLDALARAAWIGLTAKHQPADLLRSILEGVCYSQKDGLEIIAGLGAPAKTVRLSGGGAKSPFWRQLFADIFNLPVATLATQEGSAYGAALLALIGTGQYAGACEIAGRVASKMVLKDPNPAAADAYGKRYEIYRRLYPALKDTFRAIGEMDA